jgi:1,4-dihydroxy-6-naphthoate synthase
VSDNPTRIRLGISTCPNDTFTFHALMNRCVDWRGLEFQIELLDIEQLNERLFQGGFDVAKTSFHAALWLTDETIVLPCGSALGFGVGPLLLAAAPETVPGDPAQRALCPGKYTTAALLFALFYAGTATVEQTVFSEIMPMLQRGEADFGVCIHEGRFTWQDEGLSLVEDLGTRWEAATNGPLPLGGLVASRRLPAETIATVHAVIRDSLAYSLRQPAEALPTMRKYAQEVDDKVLMQHVDLYVNDWTRDLGPTGGDALRTLSRMARSIGVIPEQVRDIEIWSPSTDE